MTPEMIAILAVGAALAGLVWQSQRGLRADLAAGLREAKEDRERIRTEGREDRERLRGELNARMDRFETRLEGMDARIDARLNQMDARLNQMDARMDGIENRFDGINDRFDGINGRIDGVHGRFDGIHGVLREQGERLSRIEGMLHLHLGRNEQLAPPPAAAE